MTRYKRCPIHGYIPCTAFEAVRDGEGVTKLLADADFTTHKKIPVGKAGSDNSVAFQNFARHSVDHMIPYTKKPYLENAQIIECRLHPQPYDSDDSDSDNDLIHFCLEVSYDLIQEREHLSTTTRHRITPCILGICLEGGMSQANMYYCSVYTTMPDQKFNMKNSEMD